MPKFLKVGKETKKEALAIAKTKAPTFAHCTHTAHLIGMSFYDSGPTHFLTTQPFEFTTCIGGTKKKERYDIQHAYNSNMNGVDISDALNSSFSVYRRSRKWYRRISAWAWDTALSNASLLYRWMHPNSKLKSHVFFRQAVADALLEKFVPEMQKAAAVHQRAKKRQRSQPASLPPSKKSFRKTAAISTTERTIGTHIPIVPQTGTRPRCRICGKRKLCLCEQCGVVLCPGTCWKTWHGNTLL